MELRVLKYFLVVAEEENITRAAKQLHLTQPTLSRQMIQLEEELGVSLFCRGKTKVTLTEEGVVLKKRAQEILQLTEKTKQEMNSPTLLSGNISIGCGESQSMAIISKNIAGFLEKYPLVRFHIYSATADEIKDKLENGLLDIGLLMEPVNIEKYDFLRMPIKERWGVLVKDNSMLSEKEYVTSKDLISVPLIMARRACVNHELANWFGEDYKFLKNVATCNLIMNAANMVKNDVGAAMCLNLDAQFEGLKFIPLKPKLENGSVLVWKKGQTTSAAAWRFIEQVRKNIAGEN